MTNGGNIRVSIVLSENEHRLLILWAKFHGKAKSTYGGQVLGAKIEENLNSINQLVADTARVKGVSPKELEEQWLTEEGFYSDESDE